MIKTQFNQNGKIRANRVTKPSKKPAMMVKGIVLAKILKAFLAPILKESKRE